MTRLLVAFVVLISPLVARAQTPAATPPATTVDASRGGVTISSGVNSLTIGARAQVRWTLDAREQFDADTAGAGVGAADDPLSQFDVPRLRLSLSGGVYRPWLRYQFQMEVGRAGGERGSRIKDAALEIRPPGRSYRFQFGQFKVPFGLQQLTSSGRLQFVDRAITDAKFNPGRDMGAMLAGTVAARRIGYEAGLFNGSGESVRQNNRSHLWVGRVFIDPLGPYALAEGAVDVPARPVVHFGAGVRGGKAIRGRSATGVVDNADDQRAYNLEFAVKAGRFSSTAEHFWMVDERENPTRAPDVDSRGFHAQGGVMLVPRAAEIGVLYARVNGDTAVDDAAVTELRGVFGYYWQAHSLKLQADVGQVGYGSAFAATSSVARQGLPSLGTRLVAGEDLDDTQVRVQLTLSF